MGGACDGLLGSPLHSIDASPLRNFHETCSGAFNGILPTSLATPLEDFLDASAAYVCMMVLGIQIIRHREAMNDIAADTSVQFGSVVMIIWLLGSRLIALTDTLVAQATKEKK